eukprot:evm.model.scf_195.9 EVM.evm.TU.scf_195.9   scf_195:52259-58872(-)
MAGGALPVRRIGSSGHIGVHRSMSMTLRRKSVNGAMVSPKKEKEDRIKKQLALLQGAMPMHLRFGKPKLKSPAELVAKTNAALGVLTSVQKDRAVDRAVEDVGRYLEQMKIYIFGNDDHPASKENVLALAHEVCNQGLLLGLCQYLGELEFESRKDAALVVGALVRVNDDEDRFPAVEYVKDHPVILECLFSGYNNPTIALSCGSMLRDCIRHKRLTRRVLYSEWFLQFFDEIEERKFEVSSDAFVTFRDLVTRHKDLVAGYLDERFDEFFPRYNKCLRSKNYVTRRQLLKLLGELLLAPTNVAVMLRYVSDVQNLILMMTLLKDEYNSIQYEAFHVFKVFVANPNKPESVMGILSNNKAKLLRFLENFHDDQVASEEEETEFQNEKDQVIKEISLLEMAKNGQT